MAKLTREQKIELYKKRKEGYSLPSLSKEYNEVHPIIWTQIMEVHLLYG